MLEKNFRKLIYNLIKEDEFGRYFVAGLKAADAHEEGVGNDLESTKYSTDGEKYDLKKILSSEEKKAILNDFPEEDEISKIKNKDVENFLKNLRNSLIGKSVFYKPEKKLDFSRLTKKEKSKYQDIFLPLFNNSKGALKEFFEKILNGLK
jgi:hypothetical protein